MKNAVARTEANPPEADASDALPGDDDLGPAFDFMGTLWALKHALEVTSRRMETELGLTAPQRMTLRVVGSFPGISATRVAKLLRVHRATVTVMINRLEKRQMVKRHNDLVDRRRVTLTLTPEGRDLNVPAPATVESAIKHLLDHVDPRELAVAQRCILSLVEALEERK